MKRVERFLADMHLQSPEHHAIVQGLREIILGADPSVTEDIKYGGILFSAPTAFCGVFSYKHHVSLEFSEGAKLTDTQQLLEGVGKHRRHIKLETLNDIERKRVHEYVKLALALTHAP